MSEHLKDAQAVIDRYAPPGFDTEDNMTVEFAVLLAEKDIELTRLRAERDQLRIALHAASGYLLNAKIDLETGAQKRTAIRTIEGGLKVIEAALPAQKANVEEK